MNNAPYLSTNQFERFMGVFRHIAEGTLPPNFTINPALYDLKASTYIMQCNKAITAIRQEAYYIPFSRNTFLLNWNNIALRTDKDGHVVFILRNQVKDFNLAEHVVQAVDFESLKCAAHLILMGCSPYFRVEGILHADFQDVLRDEYHVALDDSRIYLRKIQN